MDDILTQLKSLPREVLQLIVFRLMQDGAISYAELTDMHIRHLDMLKAGVSENLQTLTGKIVGMWSDTKRNRDNNLKKIMHYLADRRMVNLTHEQIDKR